MSAAQSDHPVGTVLLAPEPTADMPGRPQPRNGLTSTRLMRVSTAHAGEWPWRRFSGYAAEVPSQWSDLSGWRVQPLHEVGEVFGC